jgi:transaldolase
MAGRGEGVRLFLDSADPAEWDAWLPAGLFVGVTTNPTLLQRAGQACTEANVADLAARAFALGAAEVQIQTWGGGAAAMAERGRRLAAIDPRVVVKVPVTRAGAEAAAALTAEGVRVTLTAVYAAHQALTGAGIGAAYVAPYLGRMTDAGRDGRAEVRAMRAILAAAGPAAPRLLVASLRSVDDLTALAAAGCDTFTFGAALAAQLFDEPATEKAARDFEAAAAAMGAEPAA